MAGVGGGLETCLQAQSPGVPCLSVELDISLRKTWKYTWFREDAGAS